MKKSQGTPRGAARGSVGTRASDFAMSKYWEEPQADNPQPDRALADDLLGGAPDNGAPTNGTPTSGTPTSGTPTGGASAVGRPARSLGSQAIRAPRRSARSGRALPVTLALALLAGAGGGAYWYLNRDDAPAASAAGSAATPATTPLAASGSPSGSSVRAAATRASALPDLSSLGSQRGGYAFRSKHNRIAIRMPHRPAVTRVEHSEKGVARTLTVSDRAAGAKMQWVTVQANIPASRQVRAVKAVGTGFARGVGMPLREQRITTFHGHRSLLAAVGPKGTGFTLLTTVWGQDRLLIIVARSSQDFALMAGSFTRNV